MADNEIFLTDGLKRAEFEIQHDQSVNVNRQGQAQVLKISPPVWKISLSYENLSDASYRALTAWLSRRDGAVSAFEAYRPDRKEPSGGATSVTAFSVNVSTSELTITTNGAALTVGDMVAYDTASGRYFGEVTNVAGSVYTVYPPLTSAAAGTPNATISEAKGRFRIDVKSVRVTEPFEPKKAVQFSAIQTGQY